MAILYKPILEFIKNKQNYLAKFEGIIDPAICIGHIYIPKEIIINKSNNNNILLLSIEKKEKIKIFHMASKYDNSIINEKSAIPIVEKIYYYGKIKDKNIINRYKLKLDISDDFIYIQFSIVIVKWLVLMFSNNPYIEYDENGKKNIILKKVNNKNYVYIDIIWLNKQKEINQKLNNFIFKIIYNYNINNKEKYKIIENNNIKCKITKSKNEKRIIEIIIFNKIENYKIYDIIYSLKIVKKEDKKNELNEELSKTIALIESNSNIIQIRNNDDNDKFIITFDNIENDFEDNFAYIEVIVQINDDYNIKYITYEPIKSKKDIEINTIFEISTIFIIIFEIISIIIIICLILFLIHYKKKLIKEQNRHAIEMKIKPLIKYDDIIIGKDAENDYDIKKENK